MKFPQFFLVHASFGTFLMLRKVQANGFRNLINAFPLKAGYTDNYSMNAVIEWWLRPAYISFRQAGTILIPPGGGIKITQPPECAFNINIY